MNTPQVKHAKYINAHRIHFVFTDNSEKIVDFLPYLKKFNHPDYAKYLNINEFKNFTLSDGNIHWNDYHMIFTPESLYRGSI